MLESSDVTVGMVVNATAFGKEYKVTLSFPRRRESIRCSIWHCVMVPACAGTTMVFIIHTKILMIMLRRITDKNIAVEKP
jgi:hypothetical protein